LTPFGTCWNCGASDTLADIKAGTEKLFTYKGPRDASVKRLLVTTYRSVSPWPGETVDLGREAIEASLRSRGPGTTAICLAGKGWGSPYDRTPVPAWCTLACDDVGLWATEIVWRDERVKWRVENAMLLYLVPMLMLEKDRRRYTIVELGFTNTPIAGWELCLPEYRFTTVVP
jgi:hypothetical protein